MSSQRTVNLSRLIRVDLRDVWQNEGSDFTPWLARPENLELLADTLGIDLEFEAQEQNVGPFRADILCKDTATSHWVLIENQLERTDHTHLGQLITYAAGLKATTIIWISNRFTEEHRAALDWLNEITSDEFNFFGIEVELWRIDVSPLAPKFNLVCKPNDWSKTVSEGAARIERGDLTELQQLRLEYWTALGSYLAANSRVIRSTKPSPDNWTTYSIGRSGFRLCAVATVRNMSDNGGKSGELRAELVMDTPLKSKLQFDKLHAERDVVECEFGEPLTWHSELGTRQQKIFIRRPADIRDRAAWPEQHAWLTKKLEALHRVFARRVKALNVAVLEGEDAVSSE